MRMNRNEEFSKLLEDVEHLNYDNHQNLTKALSRNKRHQFITKSSLSLLTTFALFTVLVNAFPSVAYAASQVPILKELAEAVNFSKSLQAAIDHEYIQSVNMTKTEGDIEVTIEYVIVETDQLHVFYTANEAYHELDVEPSLTAQTELGKSYSMTSPGELADKKLMMMTIKKMKEELGTDVQLSFTFYERESSDESMNVEDALLNPQEALKKPMANLTFDLKLDPTLVAKEKIIPVNQDVVIDSQRVTIESIEVHPTRMLVHVREDAANSKKLSTLNLSVCDQTFECYEPEAGGISWSSSDDPSKHTYELESNYFNLNNQLTKLVIKESSWYDEAAGRVKLNLNHPELSELPKGVEVIEITGHESRKLVSLKFIEDEKQNITFEWRQQYYDKDNQMYEINQWSTHIDEEGNRIVTSPIDGYRNGETIGYKDEEVFLVIDKIETIDEEVSIKLNE